MSSLALRRTAVATMVAALLTLSMSGAARAAVFAPVVNLDVGNASGGADDGNNAVSFTEGGAAVSIARSDATITDADAGDGIATLTLVVDAAPDGADEVITIDGEAFPLNADRTNVTTSEGSTTFDIDYTSSTRTFVITKDGGGEASLADTQALLRLVTYANNSDTPNTTARNVTVTANDGDADSTVKTSTIGVTDAAEEVNLSVDQSTGTEAAVTVITVTATAGGAVTGDQTVNIAVSGTGITTGDGTLSASTITILDGASTGSVTFTIQDDTLVEGTETATLTISSPSSGLTLGSTTSQNVTITDADTATVAFAWASSSVGEDGSDASVTVSLSIGTNTLESAAVLSVAASNGTTESADYDSGAFAKTVTFSAGAGNGTGITQTVSVDPSADTLVEGSEDLTLTLSVTSGAATLGGQSTHTLTITDADTATVAFQSATTTVGEDDASATDITLALSTTAGNTLESNASVTVSATNGTAVDADYDAGPFPKTVTFTAGQGNTATQTVSFDPASDALVEGDQTVTLNVVNGSLLTGNGQTSNVVTITDADAATLSINDVTVAEGDTGNTAFTFTVTLDTEVDTGVSFDFATADNTATMADSDYAGLSTTTRNFTSTAAGSTETITVQVTGDQKVELDEMFFVNLSSISASGRDVTFADEQGLGTITNDDARLTVGSSPEPGVSVMGPPTGVTPYSAVVTIGATVALTAPWEADGLRFMRWKDLAESTLSRQGTYSFTMPGDETTVVAEYGMPREFYVNDEATPEDIYCTAAGDDANSGTSPVAPKATIQALIDAYDLGPGDTVYVDSGTHDQNLIIDDGDAGLVLQGAGAALTYVNGGAGGPCLVLDGLFDGTIDGLAFVNGSAAEGGGIACYGAFVVIRNCLVAGNFGTEGGGLYCYESSPIVTNCTIADNEAGTTTGGGVFCRTGSFPTLTNCILYGNMGTGHEIAVTDGSTLTVRYCDVQGGAGDAYLSSGSLDWGAGNIDADPLFVNPGSGDYHLDSMAGYWTPGGWVQGAAMSPCIDAGDPASEYGAEPPVNGGRVNMGAFGNTEQASKSGLAYFVNDEGTTGDAFCNAPGDDDENDGLSPETPKRHIQAIIDDYDLEPGDTVFVDVGTYGENVVIDDGDSGLVIQGAGADDSIVDGGGAGACLSLTNVSDGLITGLTFRNGSEFSGGGLYCYLSDPTVTDCTIRQNAASQGAGVYCGSSSPNLTGCTITNNQAVYGGGVYCYDSSAAIDDCTVTGNEAEYGGGIYCTESAESPTISNCTISDNTAVEGEDGGYGGGVCLQNCFAELRDCTISGNDAVEGGGVHCDGSSPDIAACTISDNQAAWGGGIACYGSSDPSLTDCTISDNAATDSGGGIDCSQASCSIADSTFSGNTAQANGGGVHSYSGSPVLTRCTIMDNSAANGGGVYAIESTDTPSLTDCVISGNTATGSGGGLHFSDSSGDLVHCTISDNGADDGAGIYCGYSSPNVVDCLIIRNEAVDEGGGLCLSTDSSPTVTDCRITDNTGTYGGGIQCHESAGPAFDDCVIADNVAHENGGGIDSYDASPVLTDCTIAGNSAVQGGGLYAAESEYSPSLTDCTVSGNTAGTYGGGLCFDNSSGEVVDCEISSNTSDDSGGGIYFGNDSSPTIDGCLVSGNNAVYGAGLALEGSSPSLTGCTIANNTAGDDGGGINCYASSSPPTTNCTIVGNTAGACGGGFVCWTSCAPVIENCTLADNDAGTGGGLYSEELSDPTVRNSILWGNSATTAGPEIAIAADAAATVAYSDVEGGEGGADVEEGGVLNWQVGNLDVDPRFVDPAGGDYHLLSAAGYWTSGGWEIAAVTSHCIDAGNSASDYPNEPLPNGGRINMGAYGNTSQASKSPAISLTEFYVNDDSTAGDVYCTAVGDDANSGRSPDAPKATIQAIIDIYDLEPGDTVHVDSGMYPENVIIDDGDAGVVVQGAGAALSQVDGGGGGSRLVLDGLTDGTIEGLAFVNGDSPQGGGVACYVAFVVIRNCLIAGNFAVEGGGLYCEESSPLVTNCTIVENEAGATTGGGIFCRAGSFPTLTNCILYGNLGTGHEIAVTDGSTLTVRYCDVEGGEGEAFLSTGSLDWGDGNIDADPVFVNPSGGDYHLDSMAGYWTAGGWLQGAAMSPCIDAGDPASGYGEEPPVNGGRINMGAFGNTEQASKSAVGYFVNDGSRLGDVYCTALGDDANDGLSPGSPKRTIQAIIDDYDLEPADTVFVDVGVYPENVSIGAGDTGLIVQGAGADQSIVDAVSIGTCLSLLDVADGLITGLTFRNGGSAGLYCGASDPPMTIRGCTVRDSAGTDGGGILCADNSTVIIEDCTVRENTASSYGGGIYCGPGSSPTIRDCTVSGNQASYGGGIAGGITWVRITGGACTDNAATNDGGAMFFGSSAPEITDCTIAGNTASSGGGLAWDSVSSLSVSGCTISDNHAGGGGGVYGYAGSSPTFTDCSVIGNVADGLGSGGGMAFGADCSPVLSRCSISDNTAGSSGGGMMFYPDCSPTLTDCTVTGNTASDFGGGICFDGHGSGATQPALTGCDVSGNTAEDDGGGIYCGSDTSPTITDCAIDDNTAENGGGGGIYFYGHAYDSPQPSITGGSVSGNTAYYDGGGIYCGSDTSPTITGCIIDDNTAENGNGGGIYFYGHSSDAIQPTLTNCSVCSNTAYYDGGGIYCGSDTSPTITGCTIDDNTAENGNGGGIYFYGHSSDAIQPTLTNCSVGSNTAYYNGGGVYCGMYTSPGMTDCTIDENTAQNGYGGGMYCYGYASPTVTGGGVAGNTAYYDGGGIYCSSDSGLDLTGTTIARNEATTGNGGGVFCTGSPESLTISGGTVQDNSAPAGKGGGLYLDASSAVIETTQIVGNSSYQEGGGICSYFGELTLTRSVVAGNDAGSDGGGIYSSSTEGDDLRSVTVADNTASGYGGGLYVYDLASVRNSIFYTNSSSVAGNEIALSTTAELEVRYSNVNGGETGVEAPAGSTLNWLDGNLDVDPLYVDSGQEDYHLKSRAGHWTPGHIWVNDAESSPCIDAGALGDTYYLEPFPNGGRLNMGAYGHTAQASRSHQLPLTVQSTLLTGVPITGSHAGNTPYQRNVTQMHLVSLTAPSPVPDRGAEAVFVGWSLDGLDQGSTQPLDFDMVAPATAVARYQRLIVSEESIVVPENGQETFTVRLASEPVGDVTVTIANSGVGDGDLQPTTESEELVFTPTNWNTPQVVTIEALPDDDLCNGTATIDVSSTGLPTVSVEASELDLTEQTLVLTPPSSLSVPEGGSATFTVALSKEPCADVDLVIAHVGGDEDLHVTPLELHFTPTGYSATVTVYAMEDLDICNGSATIRVGCPCADHVDLAVTEEDNDTQSVIVTPPSITVPEGGVGLFTVRLAYGPCEALTLDVENLVGDPDLVPTPTELTFLPTDYNVRQTVTVTGWRDDDVCDGEATIRVSTPVTGNPVQWTADGVAVRAGTGSQTHPVAISDGRGGAIIAWDDSELYVQRVDSSGTTQWTAGGVVVSTGTFSSASDGLGIASDGAGGVIVAWVDTRNTVIPPEYDVYAQRLDASGAAQWTAGGVAVCTASDKQLYPSVVSDGAGGAIIGWQDRRGGSAVYAQRVDALGATQWATDGVLVYTTSVLSTRVFLESDGAGGAIVAWDDADLRAQRLDPSGTALWTTGGVPVWNHSGGLYPLEIDADGAGGALVTWVGDGAGGRDIFAQRLDSSGVRQWTSDGVTVCAASEEQREPSIVSDGAGGAVVAWADFRSGEFDIYTQRIDASGDVLWATNGVAVCTVAGWEDTPYLVGDGAGGATIAWGDPRGSGWSIYAQHVDGGGTGEWTTNGIGVCTATGERAMTWLPIVSDGAGGAIVAWEDRRAGAGDDDIYAQRLSSRVAGQLVADVEATEIDNDIQEIIVAHTEGTPLSWITVGEGECEEFTVKLSREPCGTEEVAIAHIAGDEDIWPSPTSLLFTPANYDVAQTVTLCAKEDLDVCGDEATIRVGCPCADFVDFTAYEADNDLQSVIATPPSIVVPEGGHEVFTVRLAYGPCEALTLDVENLIGDPDLVPTPKELTFLPTNYNVPQEVTVLALADDDVCNGEAMIRVSRPITYAVARWTADGVSVCSAAGGRWEPAIVSDGAGGAIIAWREGADVDLYAQRVDASGGAVWASSVALCTAANSQGAPRLVADGLGGAIAVWDDSRGADVDLYAQRINASGALLWAADGVPVCTESGSQFDFDAVSDGLGGATVAWEDGRGASPDIYAQRLNASGATQWAAGGVAVCTTSDDQHSPRLVSDGAGGAIVAWQDYRGGTADVYAQRVNGFGTVQWAGNGIAVCALSGNQERLAIVSDGAGGAIVAWTDGRGAHLDLYAQRLDSSGVAQWATDGEAVCTAAGGQWLSDCIADGAGGAIAVWQDGRVPLSDIYAQRLTPSGAPQWQADGVPVCQTAGIQGDPFLVGDGYGGAIIVWESPPSGTITDLYAQHVDLAGIAQWTTDGEIVCSAGDQQDIIPYPIVSDGAGGAIIAWQDDRDPDRDIYAQRMSGPAAGQLLAYVQATEADNDVQVIIVADTNGDPIPTGIQVPEEGSTDFTVALRHPPCEPVEVAIAHVGGDEDLHPGPLRLVFTPANYNTPQTVGVYAMDDIDVCNGIAIIRVGCPCADYVDVPATEVDNDEQVLVVYPQHITVPEGGSEVFTVQLGYKICDEAEVTIAYVSGDTDVDTAPPAPQVLTFVPGDYNVPKTVTVTAAEDDDVRNDGTVFDVSGANASSVTVTATEADNDGQSFDVLPASLAIPENQSRSFTVRLNRRPAGDVVVNIDNAYDMDLVEADPDLQPVGGSASLTFTPGNWSSWRTVTIDALPDPDHCDGSAKIRLRAAGVPDADVLATEEDDDTQGLDVSTASVTVPEGGVGVFTVALDWQPCSTTKVTVVNAGGPTDDADLQPQPELVTLTFAALDWNVPQEVVIHAAEDVDVCNGSATISISSVGMTTEIVTATEADNDTQGLDVDPVDIVVPEKGTATFTVALTHQPCATVTVTADQILGDSDLQTLPDPAILLFGPGNWNVPQAVIVTAADDVDVCSDSATIRVSTPVTGAVTQWATNGVPVCAATDAQRDAVVVSDGAGGAILAWRDHRGADIDIYAQRVDPSGATQWVAGGVPICTATGAQSGMGIVGDGSGGAIIAWEDQRGGSSADIYAQRVSASGAAQWSANGVAICAASGMQHRLEIVGDGSGGAIIAWQDVRGADTDIYVRRVDASGAVQWTANGVAVCSAAGDQQSVAMVGDGAGGAVLAWGDQRAGGASSDIYGQRVDASGAVQWTSNGESVSTATGEQSAPRMVSDACGGAFIAWNDSRSGDSDIYGQRVDASGSSQWTVDGVALCTATSVQWDVRVATDGSGGMIVAWQDDRGGNGDIYAQRMDGSAAPLWMANGVAVCAATGDQEFAQIVSDSAGGAIIAWHDEYATTSDLYAQHVDVSGTAQWTPNGEPVCTVSGRQEMAPRALASDGAGGAILVWHDERGTDLDIYAQRLSSPGGGQLVVDVTAAEADDDVQWLDVVTAFAGGMYVPEGGSATFTVKLEHKPCEVETVAIAHVSGDEDLHLSPAYLMFTPADYNVAKTVTVSAAEDLDLCNGYARIRVGCPCADFQEFVALEQDNDTGSQSLVVTPTVLTAPENGNRTFTVRLSRKPCGPVTVSIGHSGDASLQRSPTTLTFLPTNWSVPQSVTVSALPDVDVCNDSATFSVSSTGLTTVNVTATEADDDVQEVIVTDMNGDPIPSGIQVPEDGCTKFTVKLKYKPCVDEEVAIAHVGGDEDLHPSPQRLVFTSANYNAAQTVTVCAKDDIDVCNGVATVRVGCPCAEFVDVTATEVDDDGPAQSLVVTPTVLTVPENENRTFTVRLSRKPCGGVTVTIGNTPLASMQASPTLLTFQPTNWSTPQAVTLNALDDVDVCDNSWTFPVASTGLTPVNVTGIEADDDTQEIDVSTTLLNINEGSSGTFTVKLDHQPCGWVTVVIAAVEQDMALTIAPALWIFKPGDVFDPPDWNIPTTITVTLPDDDDVCPDHAVLEVSLVGHPNLSQYVDVNQIDNDAQSLVVTPQSVSVPEGGRGTFTVKLAQEPCDTVTVNVANRGLLADDPDLQPWPAHTTLTFRVVDWHIPQKVVLEAREDVDVCNGSAVIRVSSPGLTSVDVTATEQDNDTQALDVSVPSLRVLEGGQDTFTVALTQMPCQDVLVTLAHVSGDPHLQLADDKATLVFSPENWPEVRTLTITAQPDDDVCEDTAAFSIDADEVEQVVIMATEDEDDRQAIVAPSNASVAEGGETTFDIELAYRPCNDVTVTISHAGDDPDVRPVTYSVVFDARQRQTRSVTVKAAHDLDVCDGSAKIRLEAAGMDSVDVTVTEQEDDAQVLILSDTSLSVPEGGSEVFTVELGYEPCGDVTVGVARVTGDEDVEPMPTSLTFTASDYGVPKTVLVVADEDDEDVRNDSALLEVSGGGAADSVLVTVTEIDNDGQSIIVSPPTINVHENQTETFGVRLARKPRGTVTVSVANGGGDPDLVAWPQSPTVLTFDRTDWSTSKSVTVKAQDDVDVCNGNATIRASSPGLADADAAATEVEDDTGEIVVTPPTLQIDEGGQAELMVSLSNEPCGTGVVTAAYESGDTDVQPVPTPTRLTFTKLNWFVPQRVEVHAAEDSNVCNDHSNLLISGMGWSAVPVPVDEQDNDAVELVVEPTKVTVPENGRATFTVALTQKPCAGLTVTIEPTKADPDLACNPASLAFTTGDWAERRTVTVTAQLDDDVCDGETTFRVGSAAFEHSVVVTATEDDTDSQGLVVPIRAVAVPEEGTNTFTVALAKEPCNPVDVAIAHVSGDPDFYPEPTHLRFTDLDWRTAKTVTVTAIDDKDVCVGVATLHVTTAGLPDVAVKVTEVENDTQHLVVTTDPDTNPLAISVPEGGEERFFVALGQKLCEGATVTVTIHNVGVDLDLQPDEDSETLVFAVRNWDVPQPVTILAAEDDLDSAAGRATIEVRSDQLPTVSLEATEVDNDPQDIDTDLDGVLIVPENDTATFTLKLQSEPSDDVTVTVENGGGDPDIRPLPDPTILVFTPGDWDQPQTVTLFARDDVDVCDGTAIIRASAEDLFAIEITARELDDDEQKLILAPPRVSAPEGEAGVFTVALEYQPCDTAMVTITYAGGDPDVQLEPSSSTLTFYRDDWYLPKLVLCEALEDPDVCNGWTTLLVAGAGAPPETVIVDELDNDVESQALLVTPQKVTVPEGDTTTFSVSLAYQPCQGATVTITAATKSDPDLLVEPSQFVIDPWAPPQTVTVTALADPDPCAGEATFRVESAGLVMVEVTATEEEADVQSLVVGPPSIDVHEGETNTFTVALGVQPCQNMEVTVRHLTGDLDLEASAGILTFTPSNWNAAQVVTVTAHEDADQCDGAALFEVRTDGAEKAYVWANELENEIQEIVVDYPTITVIENTQTPFSVWLAQEPCGDVEVSVVNVLGDLDLQPDLDVLLFTPANYAVPQVVRVDAADDIDVCNGVATIELFTGALLSVEVIATEADDDVQALAVAPQVITMDEGNEAPFTVALRYQPCDDVVVGIDRLAGCDPDIATDVDSVTFTPSDWWLPQTVQVGSMDDVDVCDDTCVVQVSLPDKSDTIEVDLSVADDDVLRLVVEALEIEVPEGGARDFAVSLSNQPCATVTMTVTMVAGSDPDLTVESVGPSLVVTPVDWFLPRTLRVSAAVDDDAADGLGTMRVECPDCVNGPVDVAVKEADDTLFEDFETGDLSQFPWVTYGDAEWIVDCAARRRKAPANCAARSGEIGDEEESVLELTRDVAQGELTFKVKTSTHRRDRLLFLIDGNLVKRWSGKRGKWKSKNKYKIQPGVHTFQWIYKKDKKRARGQDAVWIDDIRFEPKAAAPGP